MADENAGVATRIFNIVGWLLDYFLPVSREFLMISEILGKKGVNPSMRSKPGSI
jgi:hypothetical protein